MKYLSLELYHNLETSIYNTCIESGRVSINISSRKCKNVELSTHVKILVLFQLHYMMMMMMIYIYIYVHIFLVQQMRMKRICL